MKDLKRLSQFVGHILDKSVEKEYARGFEDGTKYAKSILHRFLIQRTDMDRTRNLVDLQEKEDDSTKKATEKEYSFHPATGRRPRDEGRPNVDGRESRDCTEERSSSTQMSITRRIYRADIQYPVPKECNGRSVYQYIRNGGVRQRRVICLHETRTRIAPSRTRPLAAPDSKKGGGGSTERIIDTVCRTSDTSN